MSKRITIIGGGISGLTLLYYLKKCFPKTSQAEISLFEQSPLSGGTIQTQAENTTVFEEGANGFLSHKEDIRELVSELELSDSLIPANRHAKSRFIKTSGSLVKIPNNLFELLCFSELRVSEKWRLFHEPFIRTKSHPQETVYEFARRRLGDGFARLFIDPMVQGIYGGSARDLLIKEAFPIMYDMEKNYGSLIAATIHLIMAKFGKKSTKKNQKSHVLMSFKLGMNELTSALSERCSESIHLNQKIKRIEKEKDAFVIHMDKEKHVSDLVCISTPAWAASTLLTDHNALLSEELDRIDYAPIGVVGILYKKAQLKNVPQGFGYLNTPQEKSSVLGTLFTTSMYPPHSAHDEFLFRVMIRGNKNIDKKTVREKMVPVGIEELTRTFKIKGNPLKIFFKYWPRAIPQYNACYLQAKGVLMQQMKKEKGLFLLANYLGGVSMNDCVRNAKQMSQVIYEKVTQ